jgi:hypothetical protein
MGCGAEGMGQGQDKMDQLPQAIESTQIVWAKELVVPLSMHDKMTLRQA